MLLTLKYYIYTIHSDKTKSWVKPIPLPEPASMPSNAWTWKNFTASPLNRNKMALFYLTVMKSGFIKMRLLALGILSPASVAYGATLTPPVSPTAAAPFPGCSTSPPRMSKWFSITARQRMTMDQASPSAPNIFTLGTHTNFSIVVFKVGSNALNQISSDANVLNNFHGPRGVAVNKNPKLRTSGRIYVANANAGSAGARAVSTRGIYALDAASEDCLGLGNFAATAGIVLGSSTTFSPYKLFVGPDDSLYVGDGSTGTIGGVWRVDPNLASSVTIFGLANPGNNSTTLGTNYAGALPARQTSPVLLPPATLVLTMTAWDLNPH